MPRIIKPLKNTEKKVKALWDNLKKTSHYTTIDDFPLNKYHLIESDSQILLITPDWLTCTYYVNFEQVTNLNNQAIRQVYLWRSKSDVLPAITNIVFWKILFYRYNCIVTDTTQTLLGKEFWLRRIPEAFDNGYSVKCVNQRSGNVIDLHGMQDVYDAEDHIWGFSSKHENELIMICKK